ncbi:MAG: M48 family metalloprotease [Phycisphaerales bacterium]|nr:MAG: M48 family metalloprotease [Phycisphaerales bacterium]
MPQKWRNGTCYLKDLSGVSGFFYNLGKKVGPKVRKARWIWQSMTGSEADVVQAEHDLGQDLAREIRCQLEVDRDPEISQLLMEIGSRLAACVGNKLRTFSFEAVKGTEPNAFALPGGFLFITRPLVDLCRSNRDEIAFIIGHEMGHVIKGHAIDRIISNSAIAAASRAAPVRGALTGWLRRVGIQFLENAYSRDLELEADKLGVRLAAAAQYDPSASVKLFGRLAKLNKKAEQFDLGSYFSSHPAFGVRIDNINLLLRQ